jgi:hypothetical protein
MRDGVEAKASPTDRYRIEESGVSMNLPIVGASSGAMGSKLKHFRQCAIILRSRGVLNERLDR